MRLARTAAPAFAAGLHWSAWERALRSGAEASRLTGEVAEQAYFHHELGVLALCGGQLDRARAELEASIGLRGALADKRGTTAGRRALALVADRSGDVPGIALTAGEELPEVRHEESAPPPYVPLGDPLVTTRLPAAAERGGSFRRLARRNLVAVGSGALLAAVLGTVVTLGMTSNENADKNPAGKVDVNPSASQGTDDGTLGADPNQTSTPGTGAHRPTAHPTNPGPDGTYGTTDDPTPSITPSASPSGTKGSGGGGATPTPSKSKTTKPGSPTPTKTTPSGTPTSPTPTSPTPTPTTPTPTATSPSTTDTASGPAPSAPAASSGSASAPDSSSPDSVI